MERLPRCLAPPRSQAPPAGVARALALLGAARTPLVVVGKGAAYARAEHSLRRFIEQTGLPFLPTPMGKGVLPDDHPQCVAPARSRALLEADVILLAGARLNWMLHFGKPPRFQRDVQIIQIDLCAEELGNNVPPAVPLLGDLDLVVAQLSDAHAALPWRHPDDSPWWHTLREKMDANASFIAREVAKTTPPLNYYAALDRIARLVPRDAIIVSEGANTMDIGRSMLLNSLPRHRLGGGVDDVVYGARGWHNVF